MEQAVCFCGTFLEVTLTGCYPAFCSTEFGLSSDQIDLRLPDFLKSYPHYTLNRPAWEVPLCLSGREEVAEAYQWELEVDQLLGAPSLSYLHHLGFALGYLDQALRNKEAVPCS